MLLNIEYITTLVGADFFIFKYKLCDKNFFRKFEIVAPSSSVNEEQRVIIMNGILKFIYDTYRFTSECPFSSIKQLYDNYGFIYPDSVVRATQFYEKYKKIMDKIITPLAISPISNNYYDTFSTSIVGYNGPALGYTTTANSNTTTINVSYPAAYINLTYNG
jgi:hypothetical protein